MCEQEPTYSDLRHDVEDALKVFATESTDSNKATFFPSALGTALHNLLDAMGEHI